MRLQSVHTCPPWPPVFSGPDAMQWHGVGTQVCISCDSMTEFIVSALSVVETVHWQPETFFLDLLRPTRPYEAFSLSSCWRFAFPALCKEI